MKVLGKLYVPEQNLTAVVVASTEVLRSGQIVSNERGDYFKVLQTESAGRLVLQGKGEIAIQGEFIGNWLYLIS